MDRIADETLLPVMQVIDLAAFVAGAPEIILFTPMLRPFPTYLLKCMDHIQTYNYTIVFTQHPQNAKIWFYLSYSCCDRRLTPGMIPSS